MAQTMRDLPDEALETVLLLTSELVTNAVLHGAGPVSVHVAWGEGKLRVEVGDQAPELPVLRPLDAAAPNGRGLLFVDSLSSGWGVLAGDTGKTVWFTL